MVWTVYVERNITSLSDKFSKEFPLKKPYFCGYLMIIRHNICICLLRNQYFNWLLIYYLCLQDSNQEFSKVSQCSPEIGK